MLYLTKHEKHTEHIKNDIKAGNFNLEDYSDAPRKFDGELEKLLNENSSQM